MKHLLFFFVLLSYSLLSTAQVADFKAAEKFREDNLRTKYGDLELNPFPVPHDAKEPCQFVFNDGQRRLAILTDTGSSTSHIEEQLSGCDALVLECNHDVAMLADGDYPYSVKMRVAGDYGHLNNEQAATLLQSIDTSSLQHIVAAHISEKHNTQSLAQQTLSAALSCQQDWIAVADQQCGLDWRDVN